MMSQLDFSKKLDEALESENIEFIKKNLNNPFGALKNYTRAIEYAAQIGSLELIKYLTSKEAPSDTASTPPMLHLLFAICFNNPTLDRSEAFDYLLENLTVLGCGIQEEHILAAQGKLTKDQLEQYRAAPVDQLGLTPYDYWAISTNQQLSSEKSITQLLSQAILLQKNSSSEYCLYLFLSSCFNTNFNLIKRSAMLGWFLDNFEKLEGSDIQKKYLLGGIQKEHILAAQGKLTKDQLEQYQDVPVDQLGLTPYDYWVISGMQQQQLYHPEDKQMDAIDLNHTIQLGMLKGATYASLFCECNNYEQLEIQIEYIKQGLSPFTTYVDLDAGIKEGIFNGITLAWQLAVDDQWDLLTRISELPYYKNNPEKEINLNATPTSHTYILAGMTVAALCNMNKKFDETNQSTDPDNSELHKLYELQWQQKQTFFRNFFNHNPKQQLDLEIHTTHPESGSKGINLLVLLLKNQDVETIKQLLANDPKKIIPLTYQVMVQLIGYQYDDILQNLLDRDSTLIPYLNHQISIMLIGQGKFDLLNNLLDRNLLLLDRHLSGELDLTSAINVIDKIDLDKKEKLKLHAQEKIFTLKAILTNNKKDDVLEKIGEYNIAVQLAKTKAEESSSSLKTPKILNIIPPVIEAPPKITCEEQLKQLFGEPSPTNPIQFTIEQSKKPEEITLTIEGAGPLVTALHAIIKNTNFSPKLTMIKGGKGRITLIAKRKALQAEFFDNKKRNQDLQRWKQTPSNQLLKKSTTKNQPPSPLEIGSPISSSYPITLNEAEQISLIKCVRAAFCDAQDIQFEWGKEEEQAYLLITLPQTSPWMIREPKGEHTAFYPCSMDDNLIQKQMLSRLTADNAAKSEYDPNTHTIKLIPKQNIHSLLALALPLQLHEDVFNYLKSNKYLHITESSEQEEISSHLLQQPKQESFSEQQEQQNSALPDLVKQLLKLVSPETSWNFLNDQNINLLKSRKTNKDRKKIQINYDYAAIQRIGVWDSLDFFNALKKSFDDAGWLEFMNVYSDELSKTVTIIVDTTNTTFITCVNNSNDSQKIQEVQEIFSRWKEKNQPQEIPYKKLPSTPTDDAVLRSAHQENKEGNQAEYQYFTLNQCEFANLQHHFTELTKITPGKISEYNFPLYSIFLLHTFLLCRLLGNKNITFYDFRNFIRHERNKTYWLELHNIVSDIIKSLEKENITTLSFTPTLFQKINLRLPTQEIELLQIKLACIRSNGSSIGDESEQKNKLLQSYQEEACKLTSNSTLNQEQKRDALLMMYALIGDIQKGDNIENEIYQQLGHIKFSENSYTNVANDLYQRIPQQNNHPSSQMTR